MNIVILTTDFYFCQILFIGTYGYNLSTKQFKTIWWLINLNGKEKLMYSDDNLIVQRMFDNKIQWNISNLVKPHNIPSDSSVFASIVQDN